MWTKREYIEASKHSYLAEALRNNGWDDNQEIEIIGGLIAPDNKCSNLYHALSKSKLHEYVIGGHRQRGTEGWWIAVA